MTATRSARTSERRRDVVVLGSTGSIGTQALDVVARNPDRFRVVGLTAGRNRDLVAAQAERFGVADVALGAAESERLVRSVAADVVLNGITGSVGLGPTLAALETGASLALANKESLIVGGPLVQRAAAPGQIVPVDSEHSAIAQALRAGRHHDGARHPDGARHHDGARHPDGARDDTGTEVRRLVLTASGGPFRGRTRAELEHVTPAEALAHPTWDMGLVVTTNSATLVNKGLEVIEAHLLFDVPYDRIDVTVHAQSIVHSMVEFVDGSTIAQASPPDMRLPIALGLGWPDRVPGIGVPLDWTRASTWTFEPLDEDAFGAVRLAKEVGEQGGTFPAVFNAANEQAVAAFHAGAIGFLDIVDTVERVVAEHAAGELSLPGVLAAESWARQTADRHLAR
ncbi:1-deoxy-D-xylulose-5-phosphate reductoisomerase [Curtobacterium sp. RRHDQ10]|uniref:1-deoxy-D-xylulose-5-phosphate reductoisomerase n=1 Tax=Curtobacterium phyllosphaerae TaxID=3413379 RepID=UPI003BEFA09E